MAKPKSLLLIFLGDAAFDARAGNMLRSAAKMGFQTHLMDISFNPVGSQNLNLTHHYSLKIRNSLRFFLKFPLFLLKAFQASKHLKPDAVIASDVYSLPVAFSFGVPVYYDSREVYAKLISGKGFSLSQLLLKYIENKYIRRCSSVIVTGNLDGIDIQKTYGIPEPQVIRNYPLKSFIDEPGKIREQFGIHKAPLLVYQGVLNPGRGIDKAIEAISGLPEWRLLIVGDGPEAPRLKLMAAEKAMGRVHFTGLLPYETLLRVCVSADVGWVFIEPISESYRLALPNKLFEFIVSGIPVLATDLPAMKPIVVDHNVGICLAPEASMEEIRKTLRHLYENRMHLRENCKSIAPHFLWDAQQKQFSAIFNS